jgi:hypothetical protein
VGEPREQGKASAVGSIRAMALLHNMALLHMALLHKLREVVFRSADRSEMAWQPTFAQQTQPTRRDRTSWREAPTNP